MRELILNKEVRMTSLEVVDMINKFRLEEGNGKELLHKNLMASIRKEIEVFIKLGVKESTYIDKKGEKKTMLYIKL